MKLKLVLPLPTSINALYENHYAWNPKTRTRVPTGGKVLSKEGERVKNEIQKLAKEQLAQQEWDYEYTKINFLYMDSYIVFNRTDRDDNNVYKLNNDALEKIVYDNDKRVLTRTQIIHYDPVNPRIELTFTPVDYRGIFRNQDHLDEFENNCKTCTRYSRNCSILRKAKEARIQEEIGDDYICKSYKEKR